MTKKMFTFGAAVAGAILIGVGSATAGPPTCNWGGLTSAAIAGGFPQGEHSSDPSGDGHGPGTADEPRVGLANVVEQGNLNATCELIDSLLP
jgi:hypothetical protein